MNSLLSRHERRKQRTRRRLLDAARQVIVRLGYEATGVLDITEEADVSKATFYLHFKDKEDLTRTLILQGFDDLRAALQTAMQDAGPITALEASAPHLRKTLRVMFQYAAENRDLFRIMLGRQASAELNMMALEYFTAVVRDLIAQHHDPDRPLPYPPGLYASFVTGAAVRLGMWWIEDDHGYSPDDMAAIMQRLLSEGVFTVLPNAESDT